MRGVTRILRGLAGVLALVVLVAAIPIFLVRAVGNPWPGRDAIELRDEQEILLGVLAAAAWIVWARFVVAVAHEFVLQVGQPRRDRSHTDVAGPAALATAPPVNPAGGGLGLLASRLVALALTLIPVSQVSSPGPGPLPFRPAPLATAAAAMPGPALSDTSTPRSVSASALPVVEVHGNDSLFRIAERHLGDRARWREILELNTDRRQPDGARLTTPSSLRGGWTLLLPADAAHPMGGPAVEPVEQVSIGVDSHTATHIVEPGDSYWEIAESRLQVTLGRPASDAEVLDATNALVEANAPLFGYEDPALIHPGDEVVFPATAAWPPPVVAEPAAPEDPAPGPAAAEANAEPTTPVAERTDTTVPDPGPVDSASAAAPTGDAPVTVEAEPSTVPDGTVPPASTGGALGPSRGEARPVTGPPDTSEPDYGELLGLPEDDGRNLAVPVGLGGAVLVAGGALTIVDARRRAALRRSRAHARVRDLEANPTEVRLRALDAPERLVRLDLVLRALAVALREQQCQPLVVLVHRDGTITTALSAPAIPSAPWVAGDDGWWTLSGSVGYEELAALARSAGLPCPAIVHIGVAGAADVYVDLEAVGVLEVDAPADAAASIVDAIALGLAVSPFASGATLTMVGVDERIAETRPDIEVGFDVELATSTARSMLGTIGAATAMGATTFGLRSRSTVERWEPAVVLLGSGIDATDDLRRLAQPGGHGVALVTAGTSTGAVALQHHAGGWTLQPWALPIEPVGVRPDDVVAVVELLDEAEREQLLPPEPVDGDTPKVELDAFEDRDWELLVRVLGAVHVHDGTGTDVRFERSKAQELVCWLALHRATATRTAARTALWETDVRDATFANVVSDARRNLARLVPPPDGTEWVGRTLTESLPLHPLVVTDADLLADRVTAARGQPADVAIALLRPGLALVTDLPFAGTGYLWPDAEGSVTELILLGTTAAVEMAEHCLAAGDVEGVFWATGQGLRVLPGHEELVALRMRANARAGDFAAVRAEWGSYERALAADPWSDAEPAPKLVELRRELLGPAAAETD